MAGNRERNKLIVPAMCEGCTLNRGVRRKCPVQTEPVWLWEKYRKCWSRRTDPAVDRQIEADIDRYRQWAGVGM
jgi:hypothetical protein